VVRDRTTNNTKAPNLCTAKATLQTHKPLSTRIEHEQSDFDEYGPGLPWPVHQPNYGWPIGQYCSAPSESVPQGVAMYNDDHEPEQTSVEAEVLLAMTSHRKKKEAPVTDCEKVEYEYSEPFRKNVYTESSEVTAMTPEEASDIVHETDGIKVKPDDGARDSAVECRGNRF
jgi:hypothetical protein